jgi:hypothetical protein
MSLSKLILWAFKSFWRAMCSCNSGWNNPTTLTLKSDGLSKGGNYILVWGIILNELSFRIGLSVSFSRQYLGTIRIIFLPFLNSKIAFTINYAAILYRGFAIL